MHKIHRIHQRRQHFLPEAKKGRTQEKQDLRAQAEGNHFLRRKGRKVAFTCNKQGDYRQHEGQDQDRRDEVELQKKNQHLSEWANKGKILRAGQALL